MHPHAALIARFYDHFAARDAAGMVACYHPHATFSDPVFPRLHGDELRRMWHMLTENARDFDLTYGDIKADDTTGSARWEARYTFSKTRRPVHNVIQARFAFQDGLIIEHQDTFDFWRWSRMALGPTGVLLGWTPMVRKKVQQQAAAGLARFR